MSDRDQLQQEIAEAQAMFTELIADMGVLGAQIETHVQALSHMQSQFDSLGKHAHKLANILVKVRHAADVLTDRAQGLADEA